MEVYAGQFENVAKMSRLAPTSAVDNNVQSRPAVKLRTVYYSPDPTVSQDSPHHVPISDTDTLTDGSSPGRYADSIRRRPASGKQRLFYRPPFTGEPSQSMEDKYSLENKADLEKWRNKQRQREFKQRLTREELDEERKENRRRRVLTKKQRDQLHRQYSAHGELPRHYEAYSDIEARYSDHYQGRYGSSRSGYSTPGGSCGSVTSLPAAGHMDERNLGRSMRAAPRHSQRNRDGRYAASTKHDKDLIEMLNRQQHMLLQQREQRQKFLEEQKIKQHAQQVVNNTLMKDELQSRSKDSEQAKRLLNNAFPLAGNVHNSSNGISEGVNLSKDALFSPKGEDQDRPVSAAEQLLMDGRISHQSSRKSSIHSEHQHKDIFGNSDTSSEHGRKNSDEEETVREEGQEKYMQAIRDEFQRLQTS